jgi:hypothetical protein
VQATPDRSTATPASSNALVTAQSGSKEPERDDGEVASDGSGTLVALLSQALIAFTVEADNDYEEDAPHTTSSDPRETGPWLTSMVCWTNGLRHICDGVTAGELERRARTRPNLGGLLRWSYLREDAGTVRLTAAGREACECCAAEPDRSAGTAREAMLCPWSAAP